MAKKTKFFGGPVAALIRGALTFVGKKLKKWLNPKWHRPIDLAIMPLKEITNALSDTDPKNGEQVDLIMQKHLNTSVVPFADDKVNEVLDKIEDLKLRALVKYFSFMPLAALNIYTDDDPNNPTQLRERLEFWLEDPEHQTLFLENVLTPYLALVIKDEDTREFLITAITDQVKELDLDLDGDGD